MNEARIDSVKIEDFSTAALFIGEPERFVKSLRQRRPEIW